MNERTPPTVLIAEDERKLANLYKQYLEDEYDVIVVYSGDEAMESINEDVDVILLDRNMPGYSGDEVLEFIRSNGYDIRVAIVSAIDPDFDVIDMGFDDYLTKPVLADQLNETVERMLSRSTYAEAVRELAQLAAAKAALEDIKTQNELQNNDRYQSLEEQIADLEKDIDTLESSVEQSTAEFDPDDYKSIFRDIGTDAD